jgi:hypothetical protein
MNPRKLEYGLILRSEIIDEVRGSGHPQENKWTQVIRFEELRQFYEVRQG